MNTNHHSSFSHSVFKCARNIEKLRITIKLEQVAQCGVNSDKVTNPTSNFNFEKTFNWKERIKKIQDTSVKNEQDSEAISNEVILKDIFYTITSLDDINSEITFPFEEGNLGHHCDNSLPSLMTLRGRSNKKTEGDPSEQRLTTLDTPKQNDVLEFMHILFNINSVIRGENLNDCVLVTLKYSKSLGELKVYPGPNDGNTGYKFAPRGLSPPFFLYWIHLVQQPNIILSKPQGSVDLMIPSMQFDRVMKGELCLTILFTIHKFKYFNTSSDHRFFVNYSIRLPKGWSCISETDDQLSSTHTSLDVTNGIFQHLINYTLIYHLNFGEGNIRWPILVMGVVSECSSHEVASEGYCSLNVPPRPGRYSYNLPVNRYKDVAKGSFKKLFTGSSSNVSHELFASNLAVNDGVQGRYGLISEAVGTLNIELQSVHQITK